MSADWTVICRVDDIPRLGARRVARDRRRRRRRVPHRRRPGLRAARPLPAQGRAAVAGHRHRPTAWPARCTTGRSASPTAAPARPMPAARRALRCASRTARCMLDAERAARPRRVDAVAVGHDSRHAIHLPLLRRRLRRDHRERRRADHRRARRPRAPGQLRPPVHQGQHPAPDAPRRTCSAQARAAAADAARRARRRAAAGGLGRGARRGRRPLRRHRAARTAPTRSACTSSASC